MREKPEGQPAARFASPDTLTQQDNHLLQLGLPSVPEFIPESADRATVPLIRSAISLAVAAIP